MDCDRFDIALFRFPFSEREGQKVRPALVLSGTEFNSLHRHALMAMITTATNVRWPSDLAIEDYEGAGLMVPSVVRWKVFTLEESLYLGRVGRLSGDDRRRAGEALSQILL